MVNRKYNCNPSGIRKKVIITESTIRRDLQPEDANGVDCLTNATIFEQLTLIGYEKLSQKLTFHKAFFSPQWKFLIHTILQCLSAKTTAWNEFSSTMAFVIICLAIMVQAYEEMGEETTKTAQAKELASLKKRFKKLERKRKSKTLRMKRLFKIGRAKQVVSSKDKGLGDQEDASKQERKIAKIDADAEVFLDEQEVRLIKGYFVTAKVTTESATKQRTVDELILLRFNKIKSANPKVEGTFEDEAKRSSPLCEQEAIRLQAQFDKQERIAREKEEANAALIA
ncbi:hypothetical protein Tco_0848842 [Tanacetum coccineum]